MEILVLSTWILGIEVLFEATDMLLLTANKDALGQVVCFSIIIGVGWGVLEMEHFRLLNIQHCFDPCVAQGFACTKQNDSGILE